jgi:hypothetical protein
LGDSNLHWETQEGLKPPLAQKAKGKQQQDTNKEKENNYE